MKTQDLFEFIVHNPKIKAIIVKKDRVDLLYKGNHRDIFVLTEGQWDFKEGERDEH